MPGDVVCGVCGTVSGLVLRVVAAGCAFLSGPVKQKATVARKFTGMARMFYRTFDAGA